MGLIEVGLGLLDISFWYLLLTAVNTEDAQYPTQTHTHKNTTKLTIEYGTSSHTL